MVARFHSLSTVGSESGGHVLIGAPDGFDVIELPEAEYLQFQGEPYEEEHFGEAIGAVWNAIEKYDPAVIGYQWDDSNPRIQLEPKGERGYIELRPVMKK